MGDVIPRTNLWDKIIAMLANMVLRLATKNYQRTLQGVIDYGMNSAARDVLENRDPPEHWKVYAQKIRDIKEANGGV